jgi:hypothetical protein
MTRKCVPDNFILANGKFILATCQSVGGAEGRCLSTCIPSIQAKAAGLPNTGCATGEVCTPCFDPLSAFTFPSCCTNRGVCVPTSLVPSAQQSQLGMDLCPNNSNNYLCVAPRAFAVDAGYKPPSCSGLLLGVISYTGVCLPDCLPSLSGTQGQLVSQGSCSQSGAKCAPCTNPLTGQSTGACN